MWLNRISIAPKILLASDGQFHSYGEVIGSLRICLAHGDQDFLNGLMFANGNAPLKARLSVGFLCSQTLPCLSTLLPHTKATRSLQRPQHNGLGSK